MGTDGDEWRRFGSADHLDTLSRKRSKKLGSLDKLWKNSSLGRLNETARLRSFAKYDSEESRKQGSESPYSLHEEKK